MAEQGDWTKPAALAIPEGGYFELEQGRHGPVFPKTPANYGFTIICHVKPGRVEAIREYARVLEGKVADNPEILAALQLHYLRWQLFDDNTRFIYQGIFDTDFDTYIEDAVAVFLSGGFSTVFENLEGFPEDWKSNVPAVIKFFRDYQVPSFMEYAEYPYVSAREIKKALRVKQAFSEMLDQMQ